jgi:hypothetical protein
LALPPSAAAAAAAAAAAGGGGGKRFMGAQRAAARDGMKVLGASSSGPAML